jgi:predicted ATPase
LQRFPTARELGTSNTTATTKAVQIVLRDGTVVPAEGISEGTLCWLAFAVQPLLDPAGVLLVEHPENGLHPHRIAEVVQILRDLTERGTQVLLTTHSPLVINELHGHEVSVVTRPDELGTQVVRLDHTPTYADRRKVYENGELWLAHADGEAERALAPRLEA